MPVTDHHVAMLRAALTGRREEYRRRLGGLAENGGVRPYLALVNCAFIDAAERRFPRGVTTADEVASFIASFMSRTDTSAEQDPEVLTRVLLTAVADETITGLDPDAVRAAQHYMLAAMIVDEQLSDAALDATLARARELADAQLIRISAR